MGKEATQLVLSSNLIELIDSDQMKNINYEILKEIIDNYFEAKRKNSSLIRKKYEDTDKNQNEINSNSISSSNSTENVKQKRKIVIKANNKTVKMKKNFVSVATMTSETDQTNDVSEEKNSIILDLIFATFVSSNFIFFQSTLLPFLRKNPKYVEKHTNDILNCSVSDNSCYYINELLKLPGVDLNACVDVQKLNANFIGRAIYVSNVKAVEIALKSPKISINDVCFSTYPPFLLACRYNSDLKVLEMISNYKGFDVNAVESEDNDNAPSIAAFNGNFLALQFILNNFNDKLEISLENFSFDIFCCIKHKNFLTLKILVKFYSEFFDSPKDLVEHFIFEFSQDPDFDEEYANQLEKIINDI